MNSAAAILLWRDIKKVTFISWEQCLQEHNMKIVCVNFFQGHSIIIGHFNM